MYLLFSLSSRNITFWLSLCKTHILAIASLLVSIWLMTEQQQRPGVALSCVVEDRMLDKSLTEVRKWKPHENKVHKRIQHLRYWINLLHKRRKVYFWGEILEGDKKDGYDLRFQKINTWSHLEPDRQTLTNNIYMRGFFSFSFLLAKYIKVASCYS